MLMLDLNKNTVALDLSKVAPTLKKLKGVLNWDMHPVHGANNANGFDLDIFAFVLNASGKITGGQDVVFFNNKSFAGGAVEVPVDNRTGEGDDDEYITFIHEKMPADKNKIDVFAFIHDAVARQQSFSMVANAKFTLVDDDTGAGIAQYTLTDHGSDCAFHVGTLEVGASGFIFKPSGQSAAAEPNQVIQAYV